MADEHGRTFFQKNRHICVCGDGLSCIIEAIPSRHRSFSISASHAAEPVPTRSFPSMIPFGIYTKCLAKIQRSSGLTASFIELLGLYEQRVAVHQEPPLELSSEEATPAFFSPADSLHLQKKNQWLSKRCPNPFRWSVPRESSVSPPKRWMLW